MFGGSTYLPYLDSARLSSQLERVKQLMNDGEWRTLPQIQAIVGGSEAGISARLRDLRKQKFGGLIVNRKRIGDPSKGLWVYQVQESVQPVEYVWEEQGPRAFL